MVKERNVVVCILLTIITCGIYGIIWFVSLLISIFIFGLGHIIAILSQINKTLEKFQ